jgi:hypothetical protein
MEARSYDALSRAPDRDAFQRAMLKRLCLLTSTLPRATAQPRDLPALYSGKVERLAQVLNELCFECSREMADLPIFGRAKDADCKSGAEADQRSGRAVTDYHGHPKRRPRAA